jgi:hypothetical protein
MHTMRHHNRWIVALILSLCSLPALSSAQSGEATIQEKGVMKHHSSSRVDLEFGYFTCRRQMFREIYGSYFDYGLNFQHRINNRLSWSVRTEFIRLHEQESVVKYWSLSETPMLIYTLADRSTFVPIAGGGIGLTFRNVVASLNRVADGEVYGEVTATQRELSVNIMAMTGIDVDLSQTFVLGGRFYFDYHPLGDPSTGDFGDTGGYHFTFRLGRKF